MKVQAISGWHDTRIRAKPIKPMADYELWLRGRNNSRTRITAQQIRRAVIMRKQGETWKDCAVAVGSTPQTLRDLICFLPLDLQP